jgi:hypothetical protein
MTTTELLELLHWGPGDLSAFLGEDVRPAGLEADTLELLKTVVQRRRHLKLHKLSDLGEMLLDRTARAGRCAAVAALYQLSRPM